MLLCLAVPMMPLACHIIFLVGSWQNHSQRSIILCHQSLIVVFPYSPPPQRYVLLNPKVLLGMDVVAFDNNSSSIFILLFFAVDYAGMIPSGNAVIKIIVISPLGGWLLCLCVVVIDVFCTLYFDLIRPRRYHRCCYCFVSCRFNKTTSGEYFSEEAMNGTDRSIMLHAVDDLGKKHT